MPPANFKLRSLENAELEIEDSEDHYNFTRKGEIVVNRIYFVSRK